MNYPERGAGGFPGPWRAGAGENRGFPPVQQLDESEYATASEAGSERGRRRHRGYQDERPSAGHEDAGRSFDREDPDPPAGAGYQSGSGRPWEDAAADGLPTVQVHHCRLEDYRSDCHPGEERVCSSLDETRGRARLPRQS